MSDCGKERIPDDYESESSPQPSLMMDFMGKVGVRIGKKTKKWSKTFSWLKPLSPSAAPNAWIFINGVCCVATAAFFILAWMPSESQGYILAKSCYVPFNMLVCVLWIAEAALWSLFDEEESIWQKTGELALASYFIIDGVIYCYEWALLRTIPEAKEILLYTAIDVALYIYYFVIAADPKILSKLANWIPSNPGEILEVPSYRVVVSTMRKALVWWLPMAVTLLWLRQHYTRTWDKSIEIALFSAGLK